MHLRPARPEDAREMASLVNIASEGLAMHFWREGAAGGDPFEYGIGPVKQWRAGEFVRREKCREGGTRRAEPGLLALAVVLQCKEGVEEPQAVVCQRIRKEFDRRWSAYANGLAGLIRGKVEWAIVDQGPNE